MLKKILKSILNQSSHRKYSSSSGANRRHSHRRHSHMGHGYYKKSRKSSFFSSMSGFFSS
ncbi:hypothetical protein [Niallia endozanthoxylica]|uniref:Uncharacterized protein n=1 Tax=Niallia endozanthoxylica TaxID=2036016 RepID=A0A5J5HLK5_9BACI|nr:hypothetical protein [Niallia endozanthoxylica]KAA9021714.1 hypothetical protein F4V44_17190 [Niallia endozanthoxylica]